MERTKSSLLQIQPPNYGNLVTILSIDGGGIRGIIPATILAFLESQLQVVKEKLGESRLHETLSNVVIPTFDIKKMQPTIFSSYQIKKSPYLDARLSDICISTSAAPTYFPTYYFTSKDPEGNVHEFNLTDGGVAANNPTLVAVNQITKQIIEENSDFFPIRPMDFGRFLVISIGTGTPKNEQKFNANIAAKWGILGWLTHGGSTPLIDVFTQSSEDMVDFHIATVTQALHSQDKYLRIQDDTLTGTESSVDIATKENLEALRQIGERLLKKPVSMMNLETGLSEPVENAGTNEDALRKFAKMLSEERRLREMKSPETKKAILCHVDRSLSINFHA
ncbi:hypothetical protein L6164_024678 [Bauhinia variegata]|uniref:Uncharacterized protein n=1 Tax=Bauhinia variegata TaxID=167791 RepID=A0ACB9M0R7_BAUVA|nr:hypothetical protein L6164_024678 [Bauhinia variegata]